MNREEGFFEEYCDQEKIDFKRIEEQKLPTPDYEIFPETLKIIVEIKGFELANEDNIFGANEVVTRSTPMGLKRIRDKIQGSSRQFRNHQDRPTLLILCNSGKSHVDLSTIILKMAMFGDLSYEFPLDSEGKGYWNHGLNAPSQIARELGGSLVSAVAVLERKHINKEILENFSKIFWQRYKKGGLKKSEILSELIEDVKTTHPNIDLRESKLRLRIVCNPFAKIPFPYSELDKNWNEVHVLSCIGI